MTTRDAAIQDSFGQFDDAEQDFTAADVPIEAWTVPITPIPAPPSALDSAVAFDPREGRRLIDDEPDGGLLEWTSSSEEDNENEVDEQDEDEFFDDFRVDDEDWEISERDFTKQYNRLKQHIAVRTGKGDAPGMAQSSTNASTRVPLPAINMPSRVSDVGGHVDGNASKPSASSKTRTVDQLQALSKYTSRLARIADPYTRPGLEGLSAGVNRKGPSANANMKDKSDRATNEQVLDPRTRLILFKMIGRGLIHEVNGCVSTGKEANVYHAVTPEKTHLALKIYKTSILTFKDRDRYVSGEHRFRRGYSRHNPRKMVRVWAEKEMRNLKRLVAAGIPCPEPLEVRENVLVMRFLGDEEGWASPRLKDAPLAPDAAEAAYRSLLLATRKMFHICRLVHADLSEYNVLYHADEPWIIDVSQSVEHDHPSAFDFLRKDLANVDEFFARAGVRRTLGLKASFEFVTKVLSDDEQPKQLLEQLLAQERKDDGEEDGAFKDAYIPRTLDQVYDPERDVEKLNRGQGASLIYSGVIGVKPARANAPPEEDEEEPPLLISPEAHKKVARVHFDDGRDASGDELEDASDDDEDEDQDKPFEDRKPRGHRHEDRDAKRERKRATKEEARERRKNKMPKAEKKKRVNATKAGK